jgi:AAA15 family ATPase/GTPase
MPLKSIFIENFRGISGGIDLPIRPITLFIGANSSGKSTIIHSLATLSQTVKLPNDSRPLILDDELGSVHLGRFIEVIHSKSYKDCISLGLHLDQVPIPIRKKKEFEIENFEVDIRLHYKSTTTTQKVYVEAAEYGIGQDRFEVKRKQGGIKETTAQYEVRKVNQKEVVIARMKGGFLLEESEFYKSIEHYEMWMPILMAQRAIYQQLEQTYYLGPFRQPPLRQYPTRGASPIEVGAQGEATATLLANEVMRSRSRIHIVEISKWLHMLGIGKSLNVSRIAASDMFDLDVTLPDDQPFALADLGYGLSQVLPVLAQCSFAAEKSILLFEQPELHLHPLAVRPLASVFIDAMRKKQLTILAETHSPELIGQFVCELRNKTIKPEELVIYRVCRENKQTVIKPVEIVQEGEDFDVFELWKKGIAEP